jgi:hypothetical protein
MHYAMPKNQELMLSTARRHMHMSHACHGTARRLCVIVVYMVAMALSYLPLPPCCLFGHPIYLFSVSVMVRIAVSATLRRLRPPALYVPILRQDTNVWHSTFYLIHNSSRKRTKTSSKP